MTNVEDTVNKEYIDKHEAYLLLRHKAETYMLPATKEAYEKAAILIDSLPTVEAEPVNGWISVKDEMPKLGQRVMAFCRAGIMTFLRYDGEAWFEMSSRNEYLLSFVTHWQPLPEPPKENSYDCYNSR